MSVTPQAPRAGVLPATSHNVSIGGIIVIALFSRLWTGVPSDEAGLLFALPPIAAAGISAALGWRIALASARRVQRKSQTAGELATENNVRLLQHE